MKKTILIIVLGFSILLTGYKYYYFLFQKHNISNIIYSQKSEEIVELDYKTTFYNSKNPTIIKNEKISIFDIKKGFFYYNTEKIYINSFLSYYKNIGKKLINGNSYDFGYIEKNKIKYLVFIAESNYGNQEKGQLIYKTIDFGKGIIDLKYVFNSETSFENLTGIDIENNNQLEKLNQLNNGEYGDLLAIEVENLNGKFVKKGYFGKLLLSKQNKINRLKTKVSIQLKKQKESLKNLDYLFGIGNTEKIKEIFTNEGLDYIDNYNFNKNKLILQEKYDSNIENLNGELNTILGIK